MRSKRSRLKSSTPLGVLVAFFDADTRKPLLARHLVLIHPTNWRVFFHLISIEVDHLYRANLEDRLGAYRRLFSLSPVILLLDHACLERLLSLVFHAYFAYHGTFGNRPKRLVALAVRTLTRFENPAKTVLW